MYKVEGNKRFQNGLTEWKNDTHALSRFSYFDRNGGRSYLVRKKNIVSIAGIIVGIDRSYAGQKEGIKKKEQFCRLTIKVSRFSENFDEVPVIVAKKLIVHTPLRESSYVKIDGKVHTGTYTKDGQKHKNVYVQAEDLKLLTKKAYDEIEDKNRVLLSGRICQLPRLRETSSGRRITDLMLVVDRGYSKKSFDYIPCIAWGSNASAASYLIEGDSIILVGRFQSRKYRKKIDFYEQEKTAYEVSILDYEMNDEKNNCKKYTKDKTKKGDD